MRGLITTLLIVAVATTGCSVKKQWGASGGSKSDGVVELSYNYTYMRKPVASDSQGLERAAQMCKAWGYSGATSFDFIERKCQSGDAYGCSVWVATKKYQCN